jgi:hypothetical protein
LGPEETSALLGTQSGTELAADLAQYQDKNSLRKAEGSGVSRKHYRLVINQITAYPCTRKAITGS